MIVFDIRCSAGHRFEGWFGTADDFGDQRTRGLLVCPSCGTGEVERVPSATRMNTGAVAPAAEAKPQAAAAPAAQPMTPKDPVAMAHLLYAKALAEVLSKTEDVGRAFPEEARKMYYKEIEARPIRGVATNEEHEALLDEGVPVARLPVPPSDRLN
jgi:hypothetical protein